MAAKFDNWDDVVAFACALPDVEMLSFYGTLCPKLNGKALDTTESTLKAGDKIELAGMEYEFLS